MLDLGGRKSTEVDEGDLPTERDAYWFEDGEVVPGLEVRLVMPSNEDALDGCAVEPGNREGAFMVPGSENVLKELANSAC